MDARTGRAAQGPHGGACRTVGSSASKGQRVQPGAAAPAAARPRSPACPAPKSQSPPLQTSERSRARSQSRRPRQTHLSGPSTTWEAGRGGRACEVRSWQAGAARPAAHRRSRSTASPATGPAAACLRVVPVLRVGQRFRHEFSQGEGPAPELHRAVGCDAGDGVGPAAVPRASCPPACGNQCCAAAPPPLSCLPATRLDEGAQVADQRRLRLLVHARRRCRGSQHRWVVRVRLRVVEGRAVDEDDVLAGRSSGSSCRGRGRGVAGGRAGGAAASAAATTAFGLIVRQAAPRGRQSSSKARQALRRGPQPSQAGKEQHCGLVRAAAMLNAVCIGCETREHSGTGHPEPTWGMRCATSATSAPKTRLSAPKCC
mgnify:CR=1 FL=1